jgi:hypothetical protein
LRPAAITHLAVLPPYFLVGGVVVQVELLKGVELEGREDAIDLPFPLCIF